jgi:hypothetical protein
MGKKREVPTAEAEIDRGDGERVDLYAPQAGAGLGHVEFPSCDGILFRLPYTEHALACDSRPVIVVQMQL